MKQNKRFLISGLSALILFFVLFATSVFATDEVTVTGTVYVTAYDDNDNVKTAVIVSIENEHIIVGNDVGKELYKLDLKVVKATGLVGEDSEGNNTLTVTSYEITKWRI